MHETSMDVAMEVLKVCYSCPDYEKLLVRFWNLGWVGRPFILVSRDNVKIFREDYGKWRTVDKIRKLN